MAVTPRALWARCLQTCLRALSFSGPVVCHACEPNAHSGPGEDVSIPGQMQVGLGTRNLTTLTMSTLTFYSILAYCQVSKWLRFGCKVATSLLVKPSGWLGHDEYKLLMRFHCPPFVILLDPIRSLAASPQFFAIVVLSIATHTLGNSSQCFAHSIYLYHTSESPMFIFIAWISEWFYASPLVAETLQKFVRLWSVHQDCVVWKLTGVSMKGAPCVQRYICMDICIC